MYLLLVLSLAIPNVISSPIPEELQKPHFQVEHKAGVLDIKATKDKADVDVTSDTIRLVVEPGDRQIPVADVPPETKVVHVEGYQMPINMAWRKRDGLPLRLNDKMYDIKSPRIHYKNPENKMGEH
ncbi:uncharacterized protein LOC116612446 [Nematostella vectensis]|uniref:uncharacterized protein LOC116612446 n=1 Tax=Nematostella vectensis TaxID=45351 RepID=UPI002076D620|nr:uncharacterized protein LOC116612446 [Nematostella vectensis]